MTDSPTRSPLLAVAPQCGSKAPSFVQAWAADGAAEELPDLMFRDAVDGQELISVESRRTRWTETKVLRHGESGNLLLVAHARGLLRRHWTVSERSGERVLEVYAGRVWWRRRRHGKGPARFTLRAFRPHCPRPCLVAAPEHSRLVVRQYEGRSRLGGALAEAAFGPAARSLAASDGPAAEGEQDAGVAAALSPRADPALLACLLSIYRGLALK